MFVSTGSQILRQALTAEFFRDTANRSDAEASQCMEAHKHRELLLNLSLMNMLRSEHATSRLDSVLIKYLGEPICFKTGEQPKRSTLTIANWIAAASDMKCKKAKIILAECEKLLLENETKIKSEHSKIAKSIRALKKCEKMTKKVLNPVLCKLCMDTVEVSKLANHSFMCFEKEVVHEEVIKINKMIVKLSISCANLKTKLGIKKFYDS